MTFEEASKLYQELRAERMGVERDVSKAQIKFYANEPTDLDQDALKEKSDILFAKMSAISSIFPQINRRPALPDPLDAAISVLDERQRSLSITHDQYSGNEAPLHKAVAKSYGRMVRSHSAVIEMLVEYFPELQPRLCIETDTEFNPEQKNANTPVF